ncbi:MAG TPA: mycothiol system anti-sigma-R factor [Acidimicrobiales bacterium]|nr:mycothiol system anti-sigma-R factor [Acidimicrobiales bacterium]
MSDDDERRASECQQALDTLYHFLDGELTADRRAEIQRHLDRCSPCLEAYDFEAELKLIVARRCRDQVPESLRVRVSLALFEASRTLGGDGDGQSSVES